jgi:uncharacterized surface protein with fasciclin (FAS1) repeats
MRHRQTGLTLDVLATATNAGTFTSLVKAIKVAGLEETLQSRGPYTVFAPSDAAFAKVPAETLDALLADQQELADVLRHHVVPARIAAADITRCKGSTPKTLNGRPLSITVRSGRIYVDDELVSHADIPATNGILHVIDGVLLGETAPLVAAQ